MPKRPALESLPRTINLLAFIRLTLLQCSAFSYALSLGYLPKSLFKPVCLISLGQSRPAWEGSFRPGKQLSSSQEETAKRREEEDWKMKTSEGKEINQQGEPPNKSINRTRKPTSGYPFDHSGPVISSLGVRSPIERETTRQTVMEKHAQVSHRQDSHLLASLFSCSFIGCFFQRIIHSGSMKMLPRKDTFAAQPPVEARGREA